MQNVTTFIYNHTKVLAMMRKFKNGINLSKAVVTRFITNYLNLKSINNCQDELIRMFTFEYRTSSKNRWARQSRGRNQVKSF